MKRKEYQKSGLIIIKDSDILFLEKTGSKKRLVLAGGFQKKHEYPEQTLIREVREEINMNIYQDEFFYLASNSIIKKRYTLTKHYFILPYTNKKFKNNEPNKFKKLDWVHWETALPYLNLMDKTIIKQLFNNHFLKHKWTQ